MEIHDTEVCIVGAGPSGLAAAIGLALANVPFIVIDADNGPVAESRALVIHSGGSEVLDQLGVADELLDHALKVRAFQIYSGRRPKTTIPWDSVASPFPFLQFVPQHTTEEVLLRRLAQLGREPLFDRQVTGVKAVPGGYEVSGDGFVVRAKYVVGADGLHSTVRREVGIGMPIDTYNEAFLLGDVSIDAPLHPERAHVFPNRHGLLFFGPTKDGPWRLIITARSAQRPSTPTHEDLQRLVDLYGPGGITIKELTWAAAFQSHHGVIDTFCRRGVMLIGDASHTHSPTGGQGLNTGIQDAYDAAATLASIRDGANPEPALAGFHRRRHAAATEVLRVTHRVHRALTADTLPVHLVRRGVIAALDLLPGVRRRVAHTVSSIDRTPSATGAPTLPQRDR